MGVTTPRTLARLVVLALALWLAAACGSLSPRALPPGGVGQGPVDFAHRIDTPAAWAALAARPDSATFAHTELVKILLDRHSSRIYFIESRRWPLHYEFAERFLSTPGDPVLPAATFLRVEYHRTDRRFVLATLTHYVDSDAWAFELFANDSLSLEETASTFRAVRGLVYFGEKLRYRPVTAAHEAELARARALMPIVTTAELFGQVKYQPLELGEAYGYLRVFPPGVVAPIGALRPDDIVVLGDLPEDVPVVAGVISDQLQAPLGHINVLCHNRATPNMSLRGASTDPSVVALRDQLVRLVVSGQSYRLEAASMAEARRSWGAKRPPPGATPTRDDRDVGLPLLTEKAATEISLVGAKASQLARVARRLPTDVVPKAFALPFHAYARFLEVNGFGPKIEAMLASQAFRDDPLRRRQDLDALRAAMEAAAVPDDVLSPLMARIAQTMPAGALRFRSSTNAEDLPGFNGAGLYRSAKVKDPRDPEQVRKALREVWSSLWLWGAFEERSFYRLDHRRVGMAILVQVSVDQQIANGVAITANPFSRDRPGLFINAQASGGSVTGARGNELPEQILYYTFADGRGAERLSKSSKAGGADLLGTRELDELVEYLEKIHSEFTGEQPGTSERAVDVEFLLEAPSRKIRIVQARPYTMTWSEGRRGK